MEDKIENGQLFRHISLLHNWEKNEQARILTTKNGNKLRRSLEREGILTPFKIDPQGVVYDGNNRLKKLNEIISFGIMNSSNGKDLHWVPVIVENPQTEAEKWNLAFTGNEGFATWNKDGLANFEGEFEELVLDDINIDFSDNFTIPEQLVMEGAEPAVQEDTPPQVNETEEPVSQLGEIYQLGRHRIMAGNATNIEDLKKLLDGVQADFVYTDPPYGISIVQSASVGGGGLTHFGSVEGGKIVKTTEYSPVIGDDSTRAAIDAYNLCVSLGIKTLIFWGGNYYANSLPNSSCWVVWDKQNTGNFADCEMAWTNVQKSAKIYKQTWNGMVREGESEKRIHPTQKPVGLAFFCLTEFGNKGDRVLDLFLGSGSTIIACQQTNRTCYGMELSPAYVDLCRKRYAKFIGQADNWQEATPVLP